MDFTISPRIEDFRAPHSRASSRTRSFRSRPAPRPGTRMATSPMTGWSRCATRPAPRGCGVCKLNPETGGQGLGKMGMAVCYEEMNRSIFGPGRVQLGRTR